MFRMLIVCLLFVLSANMCTAENCSCTEVQVLKNNVAELTKKVAELTTAVAGFTGNRVPGSKCPDNWKTFGNSCYLFVSSIMSFVEAEEFCEEYGGHLVHVESYLENKYIKGQLAELKAPEFTWMGLTDVVSKKIWTWYGTYNKAVFIDWHYGEPNNYMGMERCASFRASQQYSWNDISCGHTLPFVCEM